MAEIFAIYHLDVLQSYFVNQIFVVGMNHKNNYYILPYFKSAKQLLPHHSWQHTFLSQLLVLPKASGRLPSCCKDSFQQHHGKHARLLIEWPLEKVLPTSSIWIR